jgi:hypothetical protein
MWQKSRRGVAGSVSKGGGIAMILNRRKTKWGFPVIEFIDVAEVNRNRFKRSNIEKRKSFVNYNNDKEKNMLKPKVDKKRKRAEKANRLIELIGSCGHKFFNYPDKYGNGRFEVDVRGRIWFIDGYTGTHIYLHYRYWNRGFSEGGTLRALVDSLKRYISTGEPVLPSHFGPWPKWISHGDLWGYGEDMRKVRECAVSLSIIHPIT